MGMVNWLVLGKHCKPWKWLSLLWLVSPDVVLG